MGLRFEKYEGLGNDFILIEEGAVDPAWARRLCDRHRGVGADGVLCTGTSRAGRPFMRVFNADGSVPQMCGNGVRCVALHLHARGQVDETPFTLDTDAGPHRVRVRKGGPAGVVEVWMRPPSFDPEDLPLRAARPWLDEAVEVGGRVLRVTAVSMGNPHAVTFDDVGEDARAILGPALERDPRFPERVNVGFGTLVGADLELHVWERGVGFTQACGTGACAAAAAAVESRRAARHRDLGVRLPGGELTIRVGEVGEEVRMTGPARHVFSGELPKTP